MPSEEKPSDVPTNEWQDGLRHGLDRVRQRTQVTHEGAHGVHEPVERENVSV